MTQAERIQSLDVLRGFAVLGILVMNIQSFSMVGAAYLNPRAYGDLTGANYWVWYLSHLLVDMKFMAIFSMLFGAGILLVSTRREAATGRSAGIHYRRMAWLLLFGLLHAYLLWFGDVLYTYAMCGFLIYLFRRWRPRNLILLGTLTIAFGSAISYGLHVWMSHWPEDVIADMRAEAWMPTRDVLIEELNTYRGNWFEQMSHRAISAFWFQTLGFLTFLSWRAGGLMLIGIALFKLDVFSAKRSSRFYAGLIAAGVLVGIPLIHYGVRRNEALDWELETCMFMGLQFNYWGSIPLSLGWVGLIMLMCKHRLLPWILHALAATGRMAFTNYIMQTVICTTYMYGHGGGFFGRVDRTTQFKLVVIIWIFQLLLSTVWLRFFRFGPLEWLWRSLTYRRMQPFLGKPRKQRTASVPA